MPTDRLQKDVTSSIPGPAFDRDAAQAEGYGLRLLDALAPRWGVDARVPGVVRGRPAPGRRRFVRRDHP